MAYEILDKKGVPIKRNDSIVLASDVLDVIKGVDRDKRILRMRGSDESKDRDGDIITLRGWKLENYRKNPVFLWAHDYSSVPLGKATSIKREDGQLNFNIQFPTKDLYPFADMILDLYHEKIINASSVGFIPRKFEEMEKEEGDIAWRRGRKYTEQELLELSGCAVPSNPNALQNALKSFAPQTAEGELIEILTGRKCVLMPESVDDVLEELELMKLNVKSDKVQVQVPDNIEKSDPPPPEIKVEDLQKEIETLKESNTKMYEDCKAAQESAEGWRQSSLALITFLGLKSEEVIFHKEENGSIKVEITNAEFKVGAVLNRRNKTRLTDAQKLIQEVINEATPAEEDSTDSESATAKDSTKDSEGVFDSILGDEKKPELNEKMLKVIIDSLKLFLAQKKVGQ